MDKELTIGMASYDDYDGVYFTIQALKMFHPFCNTDKVEFIVIDNNPTSSHGSCTKSFVENSVKGKYIPFTERKSTAVRNEIFKHAQGTYTICLDPHVMVQQGGISALMEYYTQNPNTKNLVQGPLLYDDLKSISTHFAPVWRSQMYGIWETNKDAYEKGDPFEIPMQGLGLFSCKTDKWAGINENFTGFGAEEGYIHEKFRLNGGKCICIPNLKWIHRFGRPNGVPYNLHLPDRIFNYFVGWLEIYKDPYHSFIKTIYDHFIEFISKKELNEILAKALACKIPEPKIKNVSTQSVFISGMLSDWNTPRYALNIIE